VDAGRTSWRLSRAQAFSAPAAERVSQQDGVEAVAIRSVDAFLQVWAHLDAKIVQPMGTFSTSMEWEQRETASCISRVNTGKRSPLIAWLERVSDFQLSIAIRPPWAEDSSIWT